MGRQAGSGPRSDMRHPENAHLLKAFKRERERLSFAVRENYSGSSVEDGIGGGDFRGRELVHKVCSPGPILHMGTRHTATPC